jgi:F-type H+-transporting ATPase subunit epsilon
MALQLLVVTPERKVVEAEADQVELPGAEGYLGILPGHTPLITLLRTGVLSFQRGGRSQAFAVSSGFAEIANDQVHVLADSAEGPAEIDVAAAERERSAAEEEMKTAGVDTLPEITARYELANARIHAARRPA